MRLTIVNSFLLILFVFIGCDQNDNFECGPPEYPSFSLTDLNPLSVTYNDTIGPDYFLNKVTLYYFPKTETWGTCQNRFGDLNYLFFEYGGVNSELIIIGVGKNDNIQIDGIIENRSLPYVKDNEHNNVWDTWCPDDRDLYFLNKNGKYHSKINLNSGFPESQVKNLIDQLLLD